MEGVKGRKQFMLGMDTLNLKNLVCALLLINVDKN